MTQQRIRKLAAAGTVAAVVAAPLAASAVTQAASASGSSGVEIVARGLNGPSEIQFGPGNQLYIANRDTGDVVKSALKGGNGKVIFNLIGNSGVAPVSSTTTFTLDGDTGESHGDTLYRGNPQTGKSKRVADLLAFEKAHNPDGQKQCTGNNCDELSNAYYLLRTSRSQVLVADAGANDIVSFNPQTAKLHLFHVFPNIRDTAKCKYAENNDPQHPGCDAVPTGMALGPNGTLFVSLLGAESPGAAKVVELDLSSGDVIRTFGHLSQVDGVAVSPNGVIYASELEAGFNPQNPDLNTTGKIIQITPGVGRKELQVATPSGLAWFDGALYAGAHSVDGLFTGQPNRGQVLRISPSAFS